LLHFICSGHCIYACSAQSYHPSIDSSPSWTVCFVRAGCSERARRINACIWWIRIKYKQALCENPFPCMQYISSIYICMYIYICVCVIYAWSTINYLLIYIYIYISNDKSRDHAPNIINQTTGLAVLYMHERMCILRFIYTKQSYVKIQGLGEATSAQL
jgi:hypothetical protein